MARDCMVVGFNSNAPQDFAIVLLAQLGAGSVISATNIGWRTDIAHNSFQAKGTGENHAKHTAATLIKQAGTVLTPSEAPGSAHDELALQRWRQSAHEVCSRPARIRTCARPLQSHSACALSDRTRSRSYPPCSGHRAL